MLSTTHKPSLEGTTPRDVATTSRDVEVLDSTLERFIDWLEQFGATSVDHQTLYSGAIGGRAKGFYYTHKRLGTLAVAPLVLCEAVAPSTRHLFGPRLRFAIADAHYAMGFALLSKQRGDRCHTKAVEFLLALVQSRSPGYRNYCWGYPFDWVTQTGTIPAATPFITSTPYVYEAFRSVYLIDGDPRWLDVCRSIAEHAATDIKDFEVSSSASSCAYSPVDDRGGVVNAAAYRAWLLTVASMDLSVARYAELARRNLAFVLGAQHSNGSWPYAMDGAREFVDHYHTCFVMKALAKIANVTNTPVCDEALQRGLRYYLEHLFDEQGLPKPFSRAPRLTVYRKELYDYAECLNLCLLLSDRSPEAGRTLKRVLQDVQERWRTGNGHFRARELYVGWDAVPMHRWGQAQMFRSLSLLRHVQSHTVDDRQQSRKSCQLCEFAGYRPANA